MGKKAALPCDTQPLSADDRVAMVLWFKEADWEPLYRCVFNFHAYITFFRVTAGRQIEVAHIFIQITLKFALNLIIVTQRHTYFC